MYLFCNSHYFSTRIQYNNPITSNVRNCKKNCVVVIFFLLISYDSINVFSIDFLLSEKLLCTYVMKIRYQLHVLRASDIISYRL